LTATPIVLTRSVPRSVIHAPAKEKTF
jgi:hypothetical protein